MQELRANTATKVRIGPFVDVGDGFTPETAVGNTPTNLTGVDEAELLKHNGVATVDITTATWAAIASCDGWYDLSLTASHTDTEGLLDVVIQDDTVCLPVFARFAVLSEAAYDSKYAPKDAGFMDVNIKTIGRADTQETEANNLEAAFVNAAGAANGLLTSVIGSATNTYDGLYAGIVTNAQGTDVATDVAAAVGTDGLCLISTEAQDLSATLDVNTKTITANAITATAINADAITAAKIADNAIASEHLATGALTADAFAANALIAATFAADYLTAINAECDTALDTAITELGVGQPTATPTMRTGLMLLYHALAFKLDVNTTADPDVMEIHNSSGTIIATKALTDDGTDYSEARSISG